MLTQEDLQAIQTMLEKTITPITEAQPPGKAPVAFFISGPGEPPPQLGTTLADESV